MIFFLEREDFIKPEEVNVMKRKNIFIYSGVIMLIVGIPLGIIRAEEMMRKGMTMKVAIPTLKGAAASFPKAIGPMKVVEDVTGQNNMCIMTFLKGRPLDKNSHEAVDLTAYVTSLSKGKKIDPGAAKIVPTPVPGAM